MFKAIRDFFRNACSNTCRDCEYYSWHRTEDELLPNKQVIKGQIVCETCEKMDSKINDITPCSLFRQRSRTHNSFHAYFIHTQGHSKFPSPPKGSSNIPRPK